MAKLTSKSRGKLPAGVFAGPDRSYPIPDKAHAANAKARASQFASPALKARVDAKANKVLAGGAPVGAKGKHPVGKLAPVNTDRGKFSFRRPR